MGQFPKTPLRLLFTAASSDALDLLSRLLTYNPLKRISALDALNHNYFSALPWPTHPANLPKTAVPLAPRTLGEQQGVEPVSVKPKSNGNGVTLKRKAEEDQRVDEMGERIAAKIGRRLEY